MSAPRRWLRLDVGWSSSNWLVTLRPGGRLAWVELLCYAKVQGIGGRVKAMAPIAAAKRWMIQAHDVTAMLEAAQANGALRVSEGEWTVTAWSTYQEPDKTAAERQRRHRAEKSRLSPLRHVTPLRGVTTVTSRCDPSEVEVDLEVKRTTTHTNDEEFEKAWARYPDRYGGNPRTAALKAWQARVNQGTDPAEIIAGVERYREYVELEGIAGTKYVKLAATFFGPNGHWKESYGTNGARPRVIVQDGIRYLT